MAEGVKEHWDRLTELGCDLAQRYYLSRPIPAGEFVQWMRYRELSLAEADDLHT